MFLENLHSFVHLLSQLVSPSVCQSVGRSVSRSVGRSVGQSVTPSLYMLLVDLMEMAYSCTNFVHFEAYTWPLKKCYSHKKACH